MTPYNDSSTRSYSSSFTLGALYALALLLTRIAQLAAIGWFTSGLEFADDIRFQRLYAADPLQLLLGRSTTFEVFPPLFPLVLWSLHTPLSWLLEPFYSMRATMLAIELLAWPLLWWLVVRYASCRGRHLLAITYIAAPMCWISTVMMCQDEVISLWFFAAIVVALLKNRLRGAILLCGIGVVVAKIYFLVPLVGLIGVTLNRSWKHWSLDALTGLAPIAVIYSLQALLTGRAGGAVNAFEDFVIPFEMSVNIWALIERLDFVSNEQARRVSGVLAVALSMLPLLVIRWRATLATSRDQVRLITAMMLWVYLSFYHINPEYGLIVVPGILIAFRPLVTAAVLIVGFSLPWAVNFFYGVGVGMERGDPGRAAFVRVYQAIFSIDPSVMQSISIIPVAVATLWLASVLTWSRLSGTDAVVQTKGC
ncbi:MAG: hypothetical protein WD894_14140 [Pirellulales bacterium]